MYTVVVTIHIIVCVILVLTVLLQQGKGAEVGAVFGSSEAMFGSAGPASALNKVTTVVAIIFMITSLVLTYLAAHRTGDSVMEGIKTEAPAVPPAQEETAPVMPPVQQEKASAPAPASPESKSEAVIPEEAAPSDVSGAKATAPAEAAPDKVITDKAVNKDKTPAEAAPAQH